MTLFYQIPFRLRQSSQKAKNKKYKVIAWSSINCIRFLFNEYSWLSDSRITSRWYIPIYSDSNIPRSIQMLEWNDIIYIHPAWKLKYMCKLAMNLWEKLLLLCLYTFVTLHLFLNYLRICKMSIISGYARILRGNASARKAITRHCRGLCMVAKFKIITGINVLKMNPGFQKISHIFLPPKIHVS